MGESPLNASAHREVYVITSVNHGEQEGVVAVFDTRALADHFAKYARRPPGSKYYVSAWKLNVIPPMTG